MWLSSMAKGPKWTLLSEWEGHTHSLLSITVPIANQKACVCGKGYMHGYSGRKIMRVNILRKYLFKYKTIWQSENYFMPWSQVLMFITWLNFWNAWWAQITRWDSGDVLLCAEQKMYFQKKISFDEKPKLYSTMTCRQIPCSCKAYFCWW